MMEKEMMAAVINLETRNYEYDPLWIFRLP
jgi:hypothetical protein